MTAALRISIASLAVGLLLCAPAAAAPRVVGGTPVAAGDYPWQVALLNSSRVSNSEAQFCGGTLIARSRVLTAAHCTRGGTPASIDVLANTTSLALGGGGRRIDVIGIDDHPQAAAPGDGTYRYDVSVLELAEPVANPRPLALVGDGEAGLWEAGDNLTVTGWGSTTAVPGAGVAPPPSYPDDLQEASVPRQTDTRCEEVAYPGAYFARDMLCASPTAGGRDTCQGDSGGPIIAPVGGPTQKDDPTDWRLVGATSWGRGCADARFPGIYARLAAPEIRSFVAGVQSRGAANQVPPTLSGTARAGEVVSCSTGTWANQPTNFAYTFDRVSDDGTITRLSLGPGNTYTAADGDVGSRVRCSVTASRPRSSARATSALVGPVAARVAQATPAPPPTPVPAPVAPPPAPAPTATPTPFAPVDRFAPRITSTRRKCTRTRCTLTIRITDAGSPAGGVRVTASLRARVRGRTRRRTLTARARSSRTSSVSVPRLGRGSYRVTLRATDRAGNRARSATVVSYRLR